MAAAALTAHDQNTGDHSDDVVTLCGALADHFALSEERRACLLAAAQLHDIGKLAVPNQILEKPGPLDVAEWEVMRGHTVEGQRILALRPELVEVGRIVRHSHERWDGGGYPDGLAGDEIPLESRIIFCADAFHAIRCDRPYRAGRSARESSEELRRNAGTQFDPAVFDALEQAAESLRESPARRLAAMTGGVGSRRLVALLLTLVVGGAAVAAPGSPFRQLLEGAKPAEAATCAPPCLPAPFGEIARLPGVKGPAVAGAPSRAPGGSGARRRGESKGGTGRSRGAAPSQRSRARVSGGRQRSSISDPARGPRGSKPGKPVRPAPGPSGEAPGSNGGSPKVKKPKKLKTHKAPGHSGGSPESSGEALRRLAKPPKPPTGKK